jgi:nucleoid-associated protein YgaU/DNA-binding SARP family transcriptional activator
MTRIKGLLALAAILAIVAGIPVVLVLAGADPLADVQRLGQDLGSFLTSPDDGTLALVLLRLVAWVAWALMTLSLLVEAAARVRGVRVRRLPGFTMPQNAARALVGTAMLTFIAVPSVANAAPAATAATEAALTPVAVTAPVNPAEVPASSTQQATPAEETKHTTRHTVRGGDTLWDLAQKYLGDGKRYGEIHDFNRHILGDKPGFLDPGDVLIIPTDSKNAPDTRSSATKDIVVEEGDTLAEIAADELGDPAKYPEIFRASQDIEQPGGARLTDPNVILPGWTVQVPRATPISDVAPNGPAPRRSQVPATAEPEVRTSAPDTGSAPTAEAGGDTADQNATDGARSQGAAPDAQQETQEEAQEATQAPQAQSEARTRERGAQAPGNAPVEADPTPQSIDTQADAPEAVDDGLSEDVPWQAMTAAGVGTILAAGVLSVIARRRRDAQRSRRPGQRLPMPTGATAEFEQEIRAASDELSRETIDAALRTLAQHCTQTGQALPVVRAGRRTSTAFELFLEHPTQLPSPWRSSPDGTVWSLDVDDTGDLTKPAVAAPYPALVTIGHDLDENAHVLLNLEHLGTLGITGDDTRTREIFAALSIELATSMWADDLQVTLVGAFPELEDTIRSGRIRYLPTVGRLIDELAARATQDRAALDDQGAPDLYTARPAGLAPDAWAPEIVLLAGSITEHQQSQIADLVAGQPHVALATVTNGVSVGEWQLTLVQDEDLAVLSPIELPLVPQRVGPEQYQHLLEMISLADVGELVDAEEAPEAFDDRAAPERLDEGEGDRTVTLKIVTSSSDQTRPRPPGDPTSFALAAVSSDVDFQDDDEEQDLTGTEPQVSEIVDPPRAVQLDGSQADVAVVTPNEEVHMPISTAPRILVLGPVEIQNADGPVEGSKRARLLEYAAYLALHRGATASAIDDAIWPDRKTEENLNTRNTATSKLRRWVGQTPDGQDYLPRHPTGGGYGFLPAVTTDVDTWDGLLRGNPLTATTEDLQAALKLVRGRPFRSAHPNRYAWAEPLTQRLASEVVDASYALGKRYLMDGRWRAAAETAAIGIDVEPAQEHLWRIWILAEHESGNREAEEAAIARLLLITEHLECDLQPETEALLAALKNPGTGFDRLMAHAL